jgi:hypothetical protein
VARRLGPLRSGGRETCWELPTNNESKKELSHGDIIPAVSVPPIGDIQQDQIDLKNSAVTFVEMVFIPIYANLRYQSGIEIMLRRPNQKAIERRIQNTWKATVVKSTVQGVSSDFVCQLFLVRFPQHETQHGCWRPVQSTRQRCLRFT